MKCKMPKFWVQLKNFSLYTSKNLKIYGFCPYLFKKLQFFFYFNKDYTFYTKILFFTTKDAQSFEKISFLPFYISKCNMPKFWVQPKNFSQFVIKSSKIYGFHLYFSKNYSFFLDFLIKSTLKIYFLQRKMPKVS